MTVWLGWRVHINRVSHDCVAGMEVIGSPMTWGGGLSVVCGVVMSPPLPL